MFWMIEKLITWLYLREFQYDLIIPIQIEIEYRLEETKVFLSSLSRKIGYNRCLLAKEARSRSSAELDHWVKQEVQRGIEGHFLSKGYALEKGSKGL
jgi:hypothetical protein